MNERAPNPHQGTAAWFDARCGKLTASRMADAMKTLKDGKPSKARRDLMIEIVTERMTGIIVPHFVTDAMRWGIEHEPAAKVAYEAATGEAVADAPFFEHVEIENFGASPDGLLPGRVFEVKAPTSTTHTEWLMSREVPECYRPQILAQLACTGREAAVFVSFDPRMPAKQRLIVREWEPKRDEIEAVEEAARAFLAECEAMFVAVTTQEAA